MGKRIDQAIDELMKLPADAQDVAAEAILDFAAQDKSPRLSDQQLAEVRRRLAEKNPSVLTLEEFDARLKALSG